MATPLPVAGWYPDPEFPGHDRWWDGSNWSDHRRGSGGYLPGEQPTAAAPAAAYAPVPVVRNNLALVGFILSASGLVLPFVLNSIAGGIVSALGLRRSTQLAATGSYSTGRGLSIAGVLVGFIWGVLCLLIVVGFIVFYLWIVGTANNVQFPDSPVI